MKVAIIGGGIAGLTAAYDLVQGGAEVTVLEAAEQWGGKIFSSPVGPVGGALVDAGPDNFLARVPDATALCGELGLAEHLTVPVSPVPAYIYRAGSLHELPTGTMLGVPTDFELLRASGLISEAGVARAEQDLILPATPLNPRTSVDDYCRARLGDEVTDVLIDPMVGGINASSIRHLSMQQGAKQLYAAAQRSPSLVHGLRMARADVGATLGSAGANQPVFHGLQGGMATLIDALVSYLQRAELEDRVTLRLATPTLTVPEGFDHVIIATQAHAAAKILLSSHPVAADFLGRIEHASVAQVTVRIPRSQIEPLNASGILVPRTEELMMTACTWFSTKWAQYADPSSVLVRITSGRFGDNRPFELNDAELIAQLLSDFAAVYADPGEPSAVRVVRWPDAFPQYQPGHDELVDSIEGALEGAGVSVIGNSYRGIGIPATIKLARHTAQRVARNSD